MKQIFVSRLITLALVIAVVIFIAVEPSRKLLNTILDNPFICFVGLVLIPVTYLIVMLLVTSAGEAKVSKSRPNFFEEMKSALDSTLLPLGFKEKEERTGWIREAKYSHNEFVVSLLTHDADLEFSLSASRKSEIKDGQKIPIDDFLVNGHLSKPDEFKSEAIAKLNEWLIEKNK
jgi:hypothetical protein